ncbi:43kDa postsynaptic protein [Trema orientale]|uniref:RING-type E3 ubiquitin transferase n=1 Tax=Trema orientale TaxID=63057 RepID=A0A2P5FR83_TREOI|nr:43kDa postsynaptic protein [Trema orientale]
MANYEIFVFSSEHRVPDDQSLQHRQFSLVFDVVEKLFSDKDGVSDFIIYKNMTQEVEAPTDYLADEGDSDLLVKLALSMTEESMPLQLDRLHWMEHPSPSNFAPPEEVGLDDMTKKISADVGGVLIRASFGQKRMGMRVTIEKRSVVPHRLYEELLRDGDGDGGGGQLPHSSTLTPLVFEYLPEEQTRLVSMESDDQELKAYADDCMICLEKVLLGSLLPCSHMFHTDCLFKWLGRSHSCPVCRSELPDAPDV